MSIFICILQGHLLAETDLNKFPSGDWVYFGWIDGLTITGTGVFDGQGASIWHLNDCQQNEKCKLLPTVSSKKTSNSSDCK